MSTILHHKYTLEEYIELDKNSEGRWEYFAGEVVDMAGGSLEHNQIVSNMIRVLGNQLADRGCRVLSSDMRLKVPKAFPYRYPDAVVVCDEPILEELQGQQMLVNPLLIVEVLSSSTEGYERGFKFTAYQSIESFQEYLLVAQDRPHITRYVRQADGQWLRSEVEGLEGVLQLVSLPCTLALSDVYRFVNFPPGEKCRHPYSLGMKCGENIMQQPQGLIEVLLDVTASEADRDDAAMDLAAYDEPEVEEALIRMGADSSTPTSVAASCGESLAEIWLRKKTLNLDALKRLQGEACHEAIGLLRMREPSWASKIE